MQYNQKCVNPQKCLCLGLKTVWKRVFPCTVISEWSQRASSKLAYHFLSVIGGGGGNMMLLVMLFFQLAGAFLTY